MQYWIRSLCSLIKRIRMRGFTKSSIEEMNTNVEEREMSFSQCILAVLVAGIEGT